MILIKSSCGGHSLVYGRGCGAKYMEDNDAGSKKKKARKALPRLTKLRATSQQELSLGGQAPTPPSADCHGGPPNSANCVMPTAEQCVYTLGC